MIRRPPPPSRIFAGLALLALVIGVRSRAAEAPAATTHAPTSQAPAEPAAPMLAEASKPGAPAPTAAPAPPPPPTPAPATHAQPKPVTAQPSTPTVAPSTPVAPEKKSSAQPTRRPDAQPTPTAATAAAVPAHSDHVTPAKAIRADKEAATENEGIQSLLKLGKILSDRADYESAEIAYYQVLNNHRAPVVDIKSALLGLGRMFRVQGALTKAAAIYERFLKDYPNDERTPDALLDLGRTLRALGVYKGAITRFYSVINSTLKLPSEGFEHYQILTKTAQFEIAETHFQSGDYTEAAKFYARLRLLDLAPDDRARAHFKSAYSLRLKGDLETAITTLRAYIDQWPADENIPEARYLLAITLREMKRPQEAFLATLELLRTEQSRVANDPKRWAYWQRRTGNQLANDFFETGNTLNAHAIYTGLVDLAPEPTWRLPLVYQIALCYERLGIQDRARTAYQTIIDTAGATPPAELAELTRMAAWRLNHLAWRDDVGRQVNAFFETTTGQPAPAAAAPPPPALADVHKPTATSADIHKPAAAPADISKPAATPTHVHPPAATSPLPAGPKTASTP